MLPLAPIAYCYASALVAGGFVLFFDALNFTSPLFLAFMALGLLPAPVLVYWAFQLEEQYTWLSKGHGKERATEVVTPPRQFRPFVKQLESNLAHASKLLMAYEKSWQRSSFMGQWYALVVALLAAVAALGLFVPEQLPAFAADHLPNTPAMTLGVLVVAIGFASAIYVACAFLTKAADANAEKLASYLEQKTEQKVHISPLHPTALLPALGVFAVLLLIPVTLLHSRFEAEKTVQQQAIEQTQKAAETLEQRLGDTLEKKDFFATENAKLLADNQKVETSLKNANSTIAKLKKDYAALQQKLAKLEATQKETATQLNTTKAELATQVAAVAAGTASLKQATDNVATLEAKLKTATDAKKAEAAKVKELTEKATLLQGSIDVLNQQIEKLKQAQAAAEPLKLEGLELPAAATLASPVRLSMPLDGFFTPQTDAEETYFHNNINQLWATFKRLLEKNPNYTLNLYVFADALPPQAAFNNNMTLTAAQAAKLQMAFAALGATPQQVLVTPMGNTYDLDSRLDADALATNRRIEIMAMPSPWAHIKNPPYSPEPQETIE